MINKIGKLLLGIGLLTFLTFLITDISGNSIPMEKGPQ